MSLAESKPTGLTTSLGTSLTESKPDGQLSTDYNTVQRLNDFKAMIKCIAAFAQIGSEDIDNIDEMNLEQVNLYLVKLQDEAMLKYITMVNEPVD